MLSPLFILVGIILGLFAFVLGGGAAYWAFLWSDLVLVFLGLFGEIILVPLAILSPVSLIIAIVTYYFSLNT